MLTDADKRHVVAAQGWFELGLHHEAGAELDLVDAAHRADPLVLCIRWQIHYEARSWEACLAVARSLLEAQPDSVVPYNFTSIALHKLGRTREAWDLALPALERFEDNWHLPYNLACYAAQLGNLDRAIALLEIATQRGDPKTVKFFALEDPDLKPVWSEIAQR